MANNFEEYANPNVYEAEYGQYSGDFNLFLTLIDKGSVLDLGCGTGRLSIPLAQKGLKVVGLDASKPMLDLAREKSKGLSVEWVQGDIRNFHLNKTFDLILMGGNTFQALLSEADQIQMLNCVKQHLKPSGIFVFNTRNPQSFDFTTTHEFEFWNRFQDHGGEDVQVYGKQQSDSSQQIVIFTTKRIWKDKETITTIHLRFTPYDELMKLLAHTGFEVYQVYGDDKKAPFEKESPSIVLVCRIRQ